MNSEQLIFQAGDAIAEFARYNDTACALYIRDGLVCCCPTREVIVRLPTCLIFSQFQQKQGLSAAGWNAVGTALFSLYNKEKLCQAHQKP